MKLTNSLFMVCLIMMCSYASSAQIINHGRTQLPSSEKSQLFRGLSQRVPAKVTELDRAFSAKKGTSIKLQFKNFDFEGVVTSSIKRYDNLYSVLIKSSSLDNTIFSISKRINDDKSITYVGRIINEDYADGYELVQDDDGGYVLNKIKTEVLLQDY
ncbi:MAG: hypothetical protein ABIN48_06470 [Ginsengibacter sp.]